MEKRLEDEDGAQGTVEATCREMSVAQTQVGTGGVDKETKTVRFALAPHPSCPHPNRSQAPDGLIFPDRATLYVTAIEDRQYKDYKIHCELTP